MALRTDGAIDVDVVISVTPECLIKITDDTLENILNLHITKLRKSKEWVAALSFSVSTLLVLLTADFKERWGINRDGWQMLFILLFIISVGYTIYTIVNCLTHQVTAKTIIIDIKNKNKKQNKSHDN